VTKRVVGDGLQDRREAARRAVAGVEGLSAAQRRALAAIIADGPVYSGALNANVLRSIGVLVRRGLVRSDTVTVGAHTMQVFRPAAAPCCGR